MKIHIDLGNIAERFLNNTDVGTYSEKDIKSVGGRIGSKKNYVGGTLGISKGKIFGNANIKGKQVGKFGPQED